MAEVILEKTHGDGLERARQGADLGEDVDAVLLVLHHPMDAAGLTLDPLEAVEVLVLVGDVPVVGVVDGEGVIGHRDSSDTDAGAAADTETGATASGTSFDRLWNRRR